jgi:hypothetical protein
MAFIGTLKSPKLCTTRVPTGSHTWTVLLSHELSTSVLPFAEAVSGSASSEKSMMLVSLESCCPLRASCSTSAK